MSGDEMNLREVGRALKRLEDGQKEHGEKLDEIKEQTMRTNGYVGRHEERLNGLDREVRDLKLDHRSAHQPQAPTPPALPSLPVSTNDGESIQVKVNVSNKVWAGICAAVAFASPFIVDWIQAWWARP